jgi:putative ABC transport system ATP-binding protein
MQAPVVIETRELTKVYGSGHTEVVAMRDVSMQVRQGELVALLGPSGSGKSTFLTAVGLINPPTSGQVLIRGQLVLDGPVAHTNLRTFRGRNIGFVFQKSHLIPFLTAVQNVQIALEVNGETPRAARTRAMELLNYLGIAERSDNLPSMLSGGEQQRVAIARALANRPGVILADEPTASLDSRLGRQVMELFAQVAHDQGAGVIVVTHDHRALDLFDTIFEMEDGTIRRQRQPQDMPVTKGAVEGRSSEVAQEARSGQTSEPSRH